MPWPHLGRALRLEGNTTGGPVMFLLEGNEKRREIIRKVMLHLRMYETVKLTSGRPYDL